MCGSAEGLGRSWPFPPFPSEFKAECLVMDSQMLFQDQQELHN